MNRPFDECVYYFQICFQILFQQFCGKKFFPVTIVSVFFCCNFLWRRVSTFWSLLNQNRVRLSQTTFGLGHNFDVMDKQAPFYNNKLSSPAAIHFSMLLIPRLSIFKPNVLVAYFCSILSSSECSYTLKLFLSDCGIQTHDNNHGPFERVKAA